MAVKLVIVVVLALLAIASGYPQRRSDMSDGSDLTVGSNPFNDPGMRKTPMVWKKFGDFSDALVSTRHSDMSDGPDPTVGSSAPFLEAGRALAKLWEQIKGLGRK